MLERCFNKNSPCYNSYGGRGITVCKFIMFNDFLKWALSSGYEKHLTLERINVNGNYEKSNCKWVTSKEQARNRRNNVLNLDLVKEIKKLLETTTLSQSKIASMFNTQQSTISLIKQGKIWS